MDITPIFVTGIIFWSTYKIFDLFVRRKERLAIIEKCAQNGGIIELPKFGQSTSRFMALRIGLLLLGMGVGLVGSKMLGYGLQYSDILLGTEITSHSMLEGLTGGMVLLWGGLGLFIAYAIERRTIRKENATNNQNNQ